MVDTVSDTVEEKFDLRDWTTVMSLVACACSQELDVNDEPTVIT